ncbi:MAG: sigma 54-interacting transcriptional regulator [Kofleriaceae bacterium]
MSGAKLPTNDHAIANRGDPARETHCLTSHHTKQKGSGMKFDERETLNKKRAPRANVFALRKMPAGDSMFELSEGQRWLIGSHPQCDIVIEDQCVSKRHCMIERDLDGALTVRDIDSRNGTYVDGNLVMHAELPVGSSLAIGHTNLLAVAAPGPDSKLAIEKIIGRDVALLTAISQAQRCASSPSANVLILGETGTGKDLFAQLIHETSRREGPFVAVNCGALPQNLVGENLFGHERGAFTGAETARDGYFIEANNGTLFLDEIGELPLDVQPNLLRVLETRRVRPVGGDRERPFDVRIVAATNRIAGLGSDGARMRQDLYHRLATVIITLPPLRERLADLDMLVKSFMAEAEPSYGSKSITDAAWHAMLEYDWPGNVRELRQLLYRATVLSDAVIDVEDLFGKPGSGYFVARREPLATAEQPVAPYNNVLRASMAAALDKHKSIRVAAAAIGMPKSTFADKARMWKLNVKRRLAVKNPTKK